MSEQKFSEVGEFERKRPCQLIIVDDEIEILEEYEDIMGMYGLDCIVEPNPEQALLQILENQEIKMLVSDLRMAGLDGGELIMRIRSSLPADRKMQFLLITGFEDANLSAKAPDVQVVQKPIDIGRLAALIKQGLNA